MNVFIRAYRILRHIPNYQDISKLNIPEAITAQTLVLGEALGSYQNDDEHKDDVWFFENGLLWAVRGNTVALKFGEIKEAKLPDDKQSKGIILRRQNDEEVLMPIKGQRGRFFDSMEVLRFLDRILNEKSSK